MSVQALMDANHAILVRVIPEAQVEDVAPPVLHEPIHLYQHYQGAGAEPFASSGCNLKRHRIGLRLLVLMTADSDESERLAWDISDRVCDEYAANRTLDASMNTSKLDPAEAEPFVVVGEGNVIYRQLRWTLLAEEVMTVEYR